MTVHQPSGWLEQRPPLRGENGESWHPSPGKHESFPLERCVPTEIRIRLSANSLFRRQRALLARSALVSCGWDSTHECAGVAREPHDPPQLWRPSGDLPSAASRGSRILPLVSLNVVGVLADAVPRLVLGVHERRL